MGTKEVIERYYNAVMKTNDIEPYLHPRLSVEWHGTRGFLEMNAKELVIMVLQASKTYVSSRIEITHLVVEGNEAGVRYKHYGTTEENQFEEKLISTSIGLWQLKDNLLYRGHVMSHSE